MNEPENANTFTPTLTAALSDAIAEAEADPEVRVLVLTGPSRARARCLAPGATQLGCLAAAEEDVSARPPRPAHAWRPTR